MVCFTTHVDSETASQDEDKEEKEKQGKNLFPFPSWEREGWKDGEEKEGKEAGKSPLMISLYSSSDYCVLFSDVLMVGSRIISSQLCPTSVQ